MTEHINKLLSCAELLLTKAERINDTQLRHTMYATARDIIRLVINPVVTIDKGNPIIPEEDLRGGK